MGVAGKVAVGALTGAAVLAAGALVVVPKAHDWFDDRHQQKSHYASGAAAKQDHASVPRWLPDGATKVTYLRSTTGGDRLISATLPDGGKLPAGCQKGKPEGTVRLSAAWFPNDAVARADARCGLYNVAVIGDRLYGWQDDVVVIAARKAGTTTE
ncbi:hypothetical protein F4556_001363 [Kitasatospora gansuensis]|uniref:Uncharacterized protein n=1 Tax=Kitasatospora gansuensis TaxID=258050 RepID=A0A7W7S8I7_9ACTN|nr:hypothetical protein [Kitasatospora gansuensis]MBB4945828.1 hypothetical protein [Kitasatospora gansuensis]